MNKLKEFIIKREFLKYFLMFFSGTLFAQIITLALSPILTRIYTPADFGIYGLYSSIIAILIVFVTGRYEFAINSVDKEIDAVAIYRIVNCLTIFSSGIIFVIMLVFADPLIETLELNINRYFLYFIPLTLLLMGLLQSSTYYLNRYKKFPTLAKSKILQSMGNGTVSLSVGLMGYGHIGLILGHIFGMLISQIYQKINEIRGKNYKSDWKNLKKNLIKHKQYPIFNAPSAFFDNIAIQAPILILLSFFSEITVGFFSLTTRVLAMPLSLISTSISQVFLSQISELKRNSLSYKPVMIKVTKYLVILFLVPTIIILVFGPKIFAIIFGPDWIVAGEYAQILIIGYFFKFVVSPLSVIFFINQKVKMLSIIQTSRAISTVILLILFSSYFDLKVVLWAYSIHETVFYIIYFYFIMKTAK